MASVDDLWLVDFDARYPAEPGFHRPALVLGPPETFGPTFPFVIVAPVTTTARGLSLHVEVKPDAGTGLDDVSYVQCELIRSVNHARLVHRLGAVSVDVSVRVAAVVKALLNY